MNHPRGFTRKLGCYTAPCWSLPLQLHLGDRIFATATTIASGGSKHGPLPLQLYLGGRISITATAIVYGGSKESVVHLKENKKDLITRTGFIINWLTYSFNSFHLSVLWAQLTCLSQRLISSMSKIMIVGRIGIDQLVQGIGIDFLSRAFPLFVYFLSSFLNICTYIYIFSNLFFFFNAR